MIHIRHVQKEDQLFWFKLDQHLSETEFERKIRDKRGYVLLDNNQPVGLLRYNLFWDDTPFCTLLFIDQSYQRSGYGKMLMDYWESEMQRYGYAFIMTSTRADEEAQHFYRRLGYSDAGGLLITVPGHEQPTELFFIKEITKK
ncbi:GNAT family N-acetyltransferase [Enterococcus sp. LJL128]|uniref:GNAT family N-acetyltransferase n=1 Tax=Enterococcus sp. LJL51 TaxID=3416656 RepID=UPI003CECFF88